ncbi:MAG: sulfite exporter TauE/SafE family protein [Gemmatimonadota bacterium]|nr:sulfite exporter TauE/SafE family protein [Gemmatimonadota bacterium]
MSPATVRALIYVALAVVGVAYCVGWVRSLLRSGGIPRPSWLESAIGFVTNFFDTLGIGSFAPTTSLYKLKNVVADERIPGTMHVGHTPPVFIQAFIFIALIEVGTATLVAMIAAAVLGAWLGAGVVASWPRRRIQIGMGVALLIAAVSFLFSIFELLPLGGAATGLDPVRLLIASAAMFVFGALMTLGIGIYAPCMITIAFLGMNPGVAFPIMMGASAFLMPVAATRFIQADRYDKPAAVGLTLGGLPAVLIAAFIVKSLPLNLLRWLVVIVVLYAAQAMLRSAARESRGAARATPDPAPTV